MFQIHRQGAHAEIALDETWRGVDILVLPVVAECIEAALFGFNLDDLGSVRREQSSGIGTGITGRESQDADAFKNLARCFHIKI